MALTDGRFPLVVYYDQTSGHSFRSVEWIDGKKRDQLILSLGSNPLDFQLVAQGSKVALAWRNWDSGYYRPFFAFREDGAWSGPILLDMVDNPKFALAMTSSGTPVMAVAQDAAGQTSDISWREWGKEGWSLSRATSVGYPIDSIKVVLDASDRPTIAWRYRNPSGTTYRTRYASRIGSGWIESALDGVTLIDDLFIDPTGNPAVIGRLNKDSPPLYVSLGANGPSSPEAVYTQPGYVVRNAASLPDGRILATSSHTLFERNSGTWSAMPSPAADEILLGDDGSVHLLGDDKGYLWYLTPLHHEVSGVEYLTAYEEGSVSLGGLATYPNGTPSILANLGGTREFQLKDSSWNSLPITGLTGAWSYAIDGNGSRHAFNDQLRYAREDGQGGMQTEKLPVYSNSWSTNFRSAIMIDSMNRPHLAFPVNIHNPDVAMMYAMKSGSSWTIEKVAPGDTSVQYCALAMDANGEPLMFTTSGLYRRTGNGWIREYATSSAKPAGIGVSSDGRIHAVFVSGAGLYSLTCTGRDYDLRLLDRHPALSEPPAFAMAGDRPMVAYGRYLVYSDPIVEPIVIAEKIGDDWRHLYVSGPLAPQDVGEGISLVASAEGNWTVAVTMEQLQTNYYRQVLAVVRGQMTGPRSGRSIACNVEGTGPGFQLDLSSAPFLEPIEWQFSSDLKQWEPLIRFGPDLKLYPGATGLQIRGDPFRSHVTFKPPPGPGRAFVRFSGVLSSAP